MAKVLIEIDDSFIDWDGWARSQLGNMAKVESVPSATESSAGGSDQSAQPAPSQAPGDPWVDTSATQTPPNGNSVGQSGDPWGSGASPTGSGTNGQQPVDAPQSPIAYGTLVIKGTNGNRTSTFGKQGAPPCNHGQPAVFTEFASGKKNWACALSATKRWKEKCEFIQWA